MIPLVLRAQINGRDDDLVCRISSDPSGADVRVEPSPAGTLLSADSWNACIQGASAAELSGDVVLVQPRRGIVQRLIRGASKHNTLLITERCDQLCVMCSQPPKKTHDDLFGHYKAACVLAPQNAVIGLSGGEPTLYKDELFDLISFALTLRPDLRFHILTNAQHFTDSDIAFLASGVGRKILWGVPLYAASPALHDEIVGKEGAYGSLMEGLSVLCRAGAPTELRTVVMKQNVEGLPTLARFITRHVPFVRPWAIMQLENIGFARNRWGDLFFDHSEDFTAIQEAVEIARISGIETALFNFPLCTVPAAYRRLAPSTISDWKRRYEPICEGCVAKRWCSGFFEWHPSDASYKNLGAL
jgi:His-Xaa-Ser system radical SAM maturase HxsC